MSQEQPPIRSRRELRRARDEQQAATPEAPGNADKSGSADTPGNPGSAGAGSGSPDNAVAPRQSRPVEPTEAETTGRRRIPGPVDTVRRETPAERSSQIRARDRAALRTIKELAEKEGQLSPGGPPTRRQLRLQQLAEETAPATSANPIVPMPSPRTQRHPVVAPREAAPEAAPQQAPESSGAPEAPVAPEAPAATEGMSVEQALAARELLAAQARNQVAKMEHIAATDPDAVDPEVLAQQIALAERAAVLNRRAAAKQKLAEQNNQQAPRTTAGIPETGAEGVAPKPGTADNGPSTASNLAMVTPLEFVEVPGMERPVMKRPATSYVPLVTNQGPKVQPRTGRRPAKQQRDAGRTGVLARAEAAAKAGRRPAAAVQIQDAQAHEDLAARPPVAANAAYGLDPLDAATAGLGRARRLHLLQLGVLALGVLALVAGVILIITGLGH
ncbi:hypothetical protein ACRQ5B_13040 [Pseudarthrobacter sp. L19]|uniref:hypothetical protein n=1 Tax=Pseudarthrobacter sp. L19 TaxID=3423951 RepID=UPI003D7BFF83